jgi:hypothetical protein
VEAGEWREIAVERLAALRDRLNGWDGEGSVRPDDALLSKAERILDLVFEGKRFPAPPTAVPCGDGSIQLEWWLVDTRFELMIEPDGKMESWALDRLSDHSVEASGPAAVELLSKWAARLTADKLLRQA